MRPLQVSFILVASILVPGFQAGPSRAPREPKIGAMDSSPQTQGQQDIGADTMEWYSTVPTIEIYRLLEARRKKGHEGPAKGEGEKKTPLEQPWWEKTMAELQMQR